MKDKIAISSETRIKNRNKRAIVILFFIFIAIFALVEINILKIHNKSLEVKKWPKIVGNVTEVSVNYNSSSCGEGMSKIEITYLYTYNARKYYSNRYSLANDCGLYDDLKEMISVINAKKTCSLYVNPNNPNESYIDAKFNTSHFFVAILLFLFPLMGLLFWAVTGNKSIIEYFIMKLDELTKMFRYK